MGQPVSHEHHLKGDVAEGLLSLTQSSAPVMIQLLKISVGCSVTLALICFALFVQMMAVSVQQRKAMEEALELKKEVEELSAIVHRMESRCDVPGIWSKVEDGRWENIRLFQSSIGDSSWKQRKHLSTNSCH